jgi:hypothetical protein
MRKNEDSVGKLYFIIKKQPVMTYCDAKYL